MRDIKITQESPFLEKTSHLKGISDEIWERLYSTIMVTGSFKILSEIWKHQYGAEADYVVKSDSLEPFSKELEILKGKISTSEELKAYLDFAEQFIETAKEAQAKNLNISFFAD